MELWTFCHAQPVDIFHETVFGVVFVIAINGAGIVSKTRRSALSHDVVGARALLFVAVCITSSLAEAQLCWNSPKIMQLDSGQMCSLQQLC